VRPEENAPRRDRGSSWLHCLRHNDYYYVLRQAMSCQTRVFAAIALEDLDDRAPTSSSVEDQCSGKTHCSGMSGKLRRLGLRY